jgi:hypothetical protein
LLCSLCRRKSKQDLEFGSNLPEQTASSCPPREAASKLAVIERLERMEWELMLLRMDFHYLLKD